jgi:hypothetical protein
LQELAVRIMFDLSSVRGATSKNRIFQVPQVHLALTRALGSSRWVYLVWFSVCDFIMYMYISVSMWSDSNLYFSRWFHVKSYWYVMVLLMSCIYLYDAKRQTLIWVLFHVVTCVWEEILFWPVQQKRLKLSVLYFACLRQIYVSYSVYYSVLYSDFCYELYSDLCYDFCSEFYSDLFYRLKLEDQKMEWFKKNKKNET